MAINKTKKYKLNIPDRGTRNWETPINENFNKIDQILEANDAEKVEINKKIESGDRKLQDNITELNNKFDSVIIESGDSNPEIVEARHSTQFDTSNQKLGNRLDYIEEKISIHNDNITTNQSSIGSLNTSTEDIREVLDNHLSNTNNPHGVTPEQINAPNMDMFNELIDDVEEFKSDNLTTMLYVQVSLESQINGLSSNIAMVTAKDLDSLKINSGRYDNTNKKIYIL